MFGAHLLACTADAITAPIHSMIAHGFVTSLAEAGRRTSASSYITGATDATGNLQTADKRSTTSWTYNPATGQLSTQSYGNPATADISFGYTSAAGQLQTIARPGSVGTAGYAAGTGEMNSLSFSNGGASYSIGRDIFGRTSHVTQTQGGQSFTIDYAYNNAGQLTSETQPWLDDGIAVDRSYYSAGQAGGYIGAPWLVQLIGNYLGPITVESRDYQAGRVHAVSTQGASFQYQYLPNSAAIDTVTASTGLTATYGSLVGTGDLSSVNTDSSHGTVYAVGYGYSPGGLTKRVDIVRTLPDQTLTSVHYDYKYNNQNQVRAFTIQDSVHCPAAWTYEYSFDASGNRKEDGFIVNAQGQYTQVPEDPADVNSDVRLSLSYDGRGNMTGYGNLIMEYDPQDRMTDDSGAVVAAYEYDPFGRPLWTEDTTGGICPFRWGTMYYDEESSLYFDQSSARYYQPVIERYLSRDPAGGLTPYGVNRLRPTGFGALAQSESWSNLYSPQELYESQIEYSDVTQST